MPHIIKAVNAKPQQSGNAFYVNGVFDNGESFSAYAKTEQDGLAVVEKLKAFVDKPLEGWTVEPAMNKETGKQREYRGVLQWNLKQPSAGGGGFRGGGGGGYKETYAQSKECKQVEQRSIQRAVALERAVELSLGHKLYDPGTVLEVADRFFAWISEVGPAPKAEPQAQPVMKGEDDMKAFQSTLRAVNQARKDQGKGPANAALMQNAIELRGWGDAHFSSWSDLRDSLGPERFAKLTKEMDRNPLKFELEELVRIGED